MVGKSRWQSTRVSLISALLARLAMGRLSAAEAVKPVQQTHSAGQMRPFTHFAGLPATPSRTEDEAPLVPRTSAAPTSRRARGARNRL